MRSAPTGAAASRSRGLGGHGGGGGGPGPGLGRRPLGAGAEGPAARGRPRQPPRPGRGQRRPGAACGRRHRRLRHPLRAGLRAAAEEAEQGAGPSRPGARAAAPPAPRGEERQEAVGQRRRPQTGQEPLAGGGPESPGPGGPAEGAGEKPERVPREPLRLGEGPGQLPQLQAAGAQERPPAQPAPARLPVLPREQGAEEHHPIPAGEVVRRAGALLRPLYLHHAAGAGQNPRGVSARVQDLHPGRAAGQAQDRHDQPGQVLGGAAVPPEPASEMPDRPLGAGTGRLHGPPRGPESVARRHAPGARHQVALPVRRCLPGPPADDALEPDQRLRHDRTQGLLPAPGLRLHAQQLAATQPAGAAAAALPSPEGAGVRREAGDGAAHLLPLLPLPGYAELPSRHEEGAPDLHEPVPEPGPAELQRLEAALHQAPLSVQSASEPSAGVLGQQQQDAAAVAAGDGSLVQRHERGAGGERAQQRPGRGCLRRCLQGAAAQDEGPGLPLVAAAARPPRLRGRLLPARRPDARLLPGLLLGSPAALLRRAAGLAASLAEGLPRLPRRVQVAGAEPARLRHAGSGRPAAAAGAALGEERRGGPARVPALLLPARRGPRRPAPLRRVAPVPGAGVAAALRRVLPGAAALPGAELPAAAAAVRGRGAGAGLGALRGLLQRRSVVGLRGRAPDQLHLFLLGLPAKRGPRRQELGLGHDVGTLIRAPEERGHGPLASRRSSRRGTSPLPLVWGRRC